MRTEAWPQAPTRRPATVRPSGGKRDRISTAAVPTVSRRCTGRPVSHRRLAAAYMARRHQCNRNFLCVEQKHDMDVMKPVTNINSVDYPAGKYCQGQSDREKIYLLVNFTTESFFFLMNFPEQRRTRNFHCTIYLQKSETDRLNNIIVEGTNRKIFFNVCYPL